MPNQKPNHSMSTEQVEETLKILQSRFEKNMHRHANIQWDKLQSKLRQRPDKLWSISEMERTGGEPDVLMYDDKTDEYVFFDCSIETPKGRRSLCYDQDAFDSRKENKPQNSAMNMATEMGIEILDEGQYRQLQEKIGNFDLKTSSWIQTPDSIRKLGGAIFADYRYGQVFVYHNGAESYYAVRGFRGLLRV